MYRIVLFILGIVLFGTGYAALFVSKDTNDRCDKGRYYYKEDDWVDMLCRDCLHVTGGGILATISRTSDILRNV